MKDKKGSTLIIVGLLLAAAALFLTAYNLYDGLRAAASAKQVLQELPPEMRSPRPAEGEKEEKGEAEQEVPDYVLDPHMEMPTVEAEGRDYIGVLRIPVLELELPVMSSWSYGDLKTAPCRYTGSVYLKNMVIAAHNYSRHFGRLKELKEGDLVSFTDADGNVFTYEVALLETLLPTDVEEMESGGWDLTLFTCTIGGSYRVTVRCELAEEKAE